MTVLVTGGAGYIGSHTALALVAQGRKTVVLDDLSRGVRKRVPAGVTFVSGDVGNFQLVAKLIQTHGITAILHFAGFIKVEESVEKPELYFRVNASHSRRLIECAREFGVEYFIFSSTAAVYGNPAVVPVGEDAPLSPLNPYGESKRRTEALLRESWLTNYCILRYFNVAGADPQGRAGYALQNQPSHLIRKALAVALEREDNLPIFGTDYPTPDGTAVRDYVHVSDLAQAHLDALEYLEAGGESAIYNVGYGKGYSVYEVHQAAQRITGKQIPLRHQPRRAGDAAVVTADTRKIRSELNWRPRFDSLDTMIADQYRWERSQMKVPV